MPRKPQRAKQLGVTDAEYERLLAAQDGKCAIEGCNRTPKTRRFHTDHDHGTLAVRGLLCHWHNRIMPRTASEAFRMFEYLSRAEQRERDEKARAEFERKREKWIA